MANVIKTLYTNSTRTDALYPRTKTKAVFNDSGVDLDTLLENAGGGGGADLNTIYPVGSIYMSTNSTSPATLFGVGTWERIKDRFLLAAGDTYSAGSTGGAATVTLDVNTIPSHNHSYTGQAQTWTPGGDFTASYASGSPNTGAKGGGQAHENMPPYLTVYIWKRTA